ncbi:hypothetical protein TeGR_g15188, partial [Tetraparma gracilis]
GGGDRARELREAIGLTADDFTDPEPAVDPLFGIDLDALATDSSVVNALFSYAVSAHRLFLSLLASPFSLLTSFLPRVAPLPLLLALSLRSSLFLLLGATGVPPAPPAAAAGDVPAMIANFVRGFFPSAFFLYDFYQVVVADLLAVFVGLLLGVATYDAAGGTGHGGALPFFGAAAGGMLQARDKEL